MRVIRTAVGALLASVFIACAPPEPPAAAWVVRFGPVIGEEAVVGRAVKGRTVWLATAEPALVRVDVDAHQHARLAVGPREATEAIWGLAMADEPGLWTLIGRDTLAQLAGDGRIVRRLPLPEPHATVLSGHGGLLYQVYHFAPPAPALQAGPPGDAERRPWSGMRTRELALPRAQAALMNIVACGPPGPGGIPCWFPDLPVVTITTATGDSSEVTLQGMRPVDPQTLLASNRPRRPILDAFLSRSDELWVLGSGEPGDATFADARGGWMLAQYTLEGRLVKQVQLPEPARLLLGVTDSSCLLLSWDGYVVEVRP